MKARLVSTETYGTFKVGKYLTSLNLLHSINKFKICIIMYKICIFDIMHFSKNA